MSEGDSIKLEGVTFWSENCKLKTTTADTNVKLIDF